MENFEVDLDTESIWINDSWKTRDELVEEIGQKLKAGDYQIAQLSQALENLNQSLEQMKELNIRISGDISDALEAAAQDLGRSTGSIVRQLLEDWLFPKDGEEEGEEGEEASDEEAYEDEAEGGDAAEGEEEGEGEEEAASDEEAAADEEIPADEEGVSEEGEAVESDEAFADEASSDPTPNEEMDEEEAQEEV